MFLLVCIMVNIRSPSTGYPTPFLESLLQNRDFVEVPKASQEHADGFAAFLDRSQYVDIGHPEACGHARYGRLFNHHDPLRNPEHHSYFVRCVERLYEVFRSPERKLFLVIDPNFRGDDAELRRKLEVLDWVLRANTCEHELLFVKNTPVGEGGDPRVETVFEFGSVKAANAFTTSVIDGVYYENAIDNETITSYLLGSYEFVRPASVSPEFMRKK